VKPGRKRKLVDEVRGEWQVSIRKACAALEFDRSGGPRAPMNCNKKISQRNFK
jgi:hypothetical protein